jgi:hypothetical protein
MVDFTYDRFKQIQTSMTYTLPDDLYQRIRDLVAENSNCTLVPPPPLRNPVNRNPAGFQTRRGKKQHECTDSGEWERGCTNSSAVEFKETTLAIKTATGITAIIGSIKLLLNKLNKTKYDEISDAIFTEIETYASDPDIGKIQQTIMDVISINEIRAEEYARLYTSLLDKFPDIFEDEFDEFCTSYFSNFTFEVCPNPDTNYDEFCNYNSRMKRRIAMSHFIKHLVLLGVIERFKVYNYVEELLTVAFRLDDAEWAPTNENILKMIAVFYKQTVLEPTTTGDKKVMELIESYSRFQLREHVGLTSKGLFALKDMVDGYQ